MFPLLMLAIALTVRRLKRASLSRMEAFED